MQALDAAVEKRLNAIQEVIVNREPYPKDDSRHLFPLLKPFIPLMLAFIERSSGGTEIPYTVDASCTGCGTCEEVCPANKIKLVDGKPEWQKDVQCYFCYACFNYCPTQSILVGKKYAQKDGRYSHPGVTANNIAAQKEWRK